MATVIRALRARRTDIALFVGAVVILIASHAFLRAMAVIMLPLLALAAPVMLILLTDRFRGTPQPEHVANFFAVVAVTGALLFLPAVVIIALAALLAMGMAWLTAGRALRALEYEREFSLARLFPGDETELQVRILNRKLLPLTWFQVSDPIHVRGGSGKHHLKRLLDVSGTIDLIEQQLSALVNRGAIGPFQEVRRSFRIKALHRGVYSFGPAEIVSGDAFGLFTRQRTIGPRTELIVYPRLLRLDEIAPSLWAAMGSMVARRTLFEDPTLIAGSREYRPDDPLHRVHWKATARTGALQVRVHDPSTTSEVMIVLNLHTFAHAWQGVEPQRMEAAIEVAASLATGLLGRDVAVGLYTNGVISDVDSSDRVPPSASPHQTAVVLEHLARISYSGGFSADALVQREIDRRSARTSIIFVTPIITPSVVGVLQSAGARDRVSVVYCGRFAAPVIRGVTIHLATPFVEDARAVS